VAAILRFTGAVKRDPAIARWFDEQPKVLRSIAEPWFEFMRQRGADVLELFHDGLATACVGDAPFAYVGVFSEHVNVGFFQGASLPDPAHLLEGNGKFMRHVKIRPGFPVDRSALESLITAAYQDILKRMKADQ